MRRPAGRSLVSAGAAHFASAPKPSGPPPWLIALAVLAAPAPAYVLLTSS